LFLEYQVTHVIFRISGYASHFEKFVDLWEFEVEPLVISARIAEFGTWIFGHCRDAETEMFDFVAGIILQQGYISSKIISVVLLRYWKVPF
jgi:hypothetical protein